MGRHRRTRRLDRKATVAVASAVLAGGGLVGYVASAAASVPNSNGKIYACYNHKSGALRVVNYPSKHCHSDERLLSWNQHGPRGRSGRNGARGPAGPAQYSLLEQGNSGATSSALCPGGWVSTGGGFGQLAGTLTSSEPLVDNVNGYQVPVGWRASATGSVVAYAVCERGPSNASQVLTGTPTTPSSTSPSPSTSASTSVSPSTSTSASTSASASTSSGGGIPCIQPNVPPGCTG